MNSIIPEVVCDASYELVIKRSSAILVMNLKVTLEIRQLVPPFLKAEIFENQLDSFYR